MQKIDCEAVKELLFDYVSDVLGDEERAAVSAHINQCPECRQEFEAIQAILGAAASIEDVEVPAGLKASVFERIRQENGKPQSNRRLVIRNIVRVALPVAACAALAIGIYSSGLYDKFVDSDNTVSSGLTSPANNASSSKKADDNTETAQSEKPSGTADNQSTPNDKKTELPTDRNTSSAHSKSSHESSGAVTNDYSDTPPSRTTKSGRQTDSAAKPQNAEAAQGTDAAAENTAPAKTTAPAEEIAPAAVEGSAVPADNTDNSAAPAAGESRSFSMKKDAAPESKNEESDADFGMQRSSAPMMTSGMIDVDEDASSYEEATPKASADTAGGASGGGGGASSGSSSASASVYNGASSSQATQIPSSCTIITDDPAAFAAKFGVSADGTGSTTFELDGSKWETLRAYAREVGAVLNAEYGGNTGSISVTVKVKY